MDKAGHSLTTIVRLSPNRYADGYFEEVATKCPNVHTICLPPYSSLDEKRHITRILKEMKKLRTVKLYRYRESFREMEQSLPHLEFIKYSREMFISYTDQKRKKYLD